MSTMTVSITDEQLVASLDALQCNVVMLLSRYQQLQQETLLLKQQLKQEQDLSRELREKIEIVSQRISIIAAKIPSHFLQEEESVDALI